MQIKSISDIKPGDILFKDTEFNDKGKSFVFKVANWVTKKIQGTKDKDHTETFIWVKGILCVASSVSGTGVRIQNFRLWRIREGYPKIEILRPPKNLNRRQESDLLKEITKDLGLPYALPYALKSKDKRKEDGKELPPRDLVETGIFCSETTGKWNKVEKWQDDWPAVLYNKLNNKGYSTIFKSESKEL